MVSGFILGFIIGAIAAVLTLYGLAVYILLWKKEEPFFPDPEGEG